MPLYRCSLDLVLLDFVSFPLWVRNNLHTGEPRRVVATLAGPDDGFRQVLLVLPTPRATAGKQRLEARGVVYNVYNGQVLSQFARVMKKLDSPFLFHEGPALLPEVYKSGLQAQNDFILAPDNAQPGGDSGKKSDVRGLTGASGSRLAAAPRTRADQKAPSVAQGLAKTLVGIYNAMLVLDNVLELLRPGSTRLSDEPFVHESKKNLRASVESLRFGELRQSMLGQLDYYDKLKYQTVKCVVCFGSCFVPGVGLVITQCDHPICRTCQHTLRTNTLFKKFIRQGECSLCKKQIAPQTIEIPSIPKYEWYFNPLEPCDVCGEEEYDHVCKHTWPTPMNFKRRMLEFKIKVFDFRHYSHRLTDNTEFGVLPFGVKMGFLVFSRLPDYSYAVYYDTMYQLSATPEYVTITVDYQSFTFKDFKVRLHNSTLKTYSPEDLKGRETTRIKSKDLLNVLKIVCEDVGKERDKAKERRDLDMIFRMSNLSEYMMKRELKLQFPLKDLLRKCNQHFWGGAAVGT